MSNPIPGVPGAFPQISSLPTTPAGGSGKQGGFGASLASAVEQVEHLHTDAQGQVTEMLQNGGHDLHNVMIAVEKADVSFQLMMQVRNKIINAYQEISRLQF
jgi:flagellar hook-basal body complex protein FliE